MENYQISINLLCLAEDERKQLMGLIEKANKGVPIHGDWKGKKVWYISEDHDDAVATQWTGSAWQTTYDSRGMIYATKEEAEEALQRVKYQTMWRRLSDASGENGRPWDGRTEHWHVWYGVKTHLLDLHAAVANFGGFAYFSSRESLEDAIQRIGKENVKRYVLGVKE